MNVNTERRLKFSQRIASHQNSSPIQKDRKSNIPSFAPQMQFRANDHHKVIILLMEKRFQVTIAGIVSIAKVTLSKAQLGIIFPLWYHNAIEMYPFECINGTVRDYYECKNVTLT
jgi:hypothetical protein